jgi:hypothetical protein
MVREVLEREADLRICGGMTGLKPSIKLDFFSPM